MGKKKGLINKRKVADSETKSLLNFMIHDDEIEEGKELRKNILTLLDDEEYVDPERVANVIKNRVERGESAEEIAYYSHSVLTAVVSHLQIPGRSKMTTKMQMAKALVKHFGGKKKKKKK